MPENALVLQICGRFDLSVTHERWAASDEPSKYGRFRYPDNIPRPLREVAQEKVLNISLPMLTTIISP